MTWWGWFLLALAAQPVLALLWHLFVRNRKHQEMPC